MTAGQTDPLSKCCQPCCQGAEVCGETRVLPVEVRAVRRAYPTKGGKRAGDDGTPRQRSNPLLLPWDPLVLRVDLFVNPYHLCLCLFRLWNLCLFCFHLWVCRGYCASPSGWCRSCGVDSQSQDGRWRRKGCKRGFDRSLGMWICRMLRPGSYHCIDFCCIDCRSRSGLRQGRSECAGLHPTFWRPTDRH